MGRGRRRVGTRPAGRVALRSLVACLLISLGAAGAAAQRPRIESFTLGDGLPSSNLLDLAQTASGHLWIASRAGVTVYDGTSFRTFTGAEGLPGQVFGALAVDDRDRVWAVSRREIRLYRQDGPRWRRLPLPPNASASGWATALAVFAVKTESGRVHRALIGTTDGGLLFWDGQEWSRVGEESGLPSGRVHGLGRWVPRGADGASREPRFLVGTSAGACVLETRELACRPPHRSLGLDRPVFALHADAERPSRLWVLAAGWLGFIENGRRQVVLDGIDLRLGVPRELRLGSLAVDRAGGIYYGTRMQLFYRDPRSGRVEALGVREGLSSEGATALLHDREGNVWIGSERGLAKISSRRFLSLDRYQGLLESEVAAVVEPEPGLLVFGHNNGFTFLAEGETLQAAFESGPVSPMRELRVLDLAVDPSGRVWAAARSQGLLRLRPDRTWVRDFDVDVFSVEVDAAGNLWAATRQQLFRRRAGVFEEVPLGVDPEVHGYLRWLTAAPDGRLWISSRYGLLVPDPDGARWRFVRGPEEDASNVYGVLVEPSGEVWVGTHAGLYGLDEDGLVRRSRPAVDRPIFLLLEDPRGRVWLGTDDGVYVWDGRELRHLSVRHGLAGRETNRGAGLVDHRGRVWIGTDQGVSVYQEHYDLEPAAPPAVELRSLEVGGRPWPLEPGSSTSPIELAHWQHNLSFGVGAVFHSPEERVLYRYRLDGFDGAWQGPEPAGRSEIRYTNLPPGSYRFRISAGWEDGPWGDEAVSPAIVVARPFWLMPWFYGAVLAVAVLALVAGDRVRTRAIRRRNRELEALIAERRRVEAERERLIEDLEAKNMELERFTYTVSHDLKSPLVTITGFLGLLERDVAAGHEDRVRRDVDRIQAAADRMAQLLDELLELSRVGRIANPPEAVELGELVREAAELASGVLEERGVELRVADGLPAVYGDRGRLLEVFENLLSNAAKFMGDQVAPRIEVEARRRNGEVLCSVRDNGIGIDPQYHEKVFGLFERLDGQPGGTGIGLALVRRIVKVHGGRVWVESEGAGRGSTFYLTLPPSPPGRLTRDPAGG